MLYANDDFFAPKENLLKPPPRSSSKANTLIAANGWTAGSRVAAARPDLIGASSGSACRVSFAAWSLIPVTSKAIIPKAVRWKRVDYRWLAHDRQLTSDSLQWTEILPQSNLNGDSQNPFPISSDQRWTHLRFKIFPDGGVARCGCMARSVPDWDRLREIGGEIDLAAVENGGHGACHAATCSLVIVTI